MTQTLSLLTGKTLNEQQQLDSLTAKAQACAILDYNPLFLDTETTGTDSQAQIIEIAVIDLQGNVLVNALVKPTVPVGAEAEAITHISNAMLENAPSFMGIWKQLQRTLQCRNVIAYNAAFDLRMLMQSMLLYGECSFPAFASVTCAMQLFSAFAAVPGRYGTYKWHKLGEAADMLRIPPDFTLHRALADTVTLRNIMLAMGRSTL